MRLLVIVSFLNEERYLPDFLASVAAQTAPPSRLLLVDDGSTDRSAELAAQFAGEHDWATLLQRPPRPPERDRLATAAELRSFQWALDRAPDDWDVLSKMDADLRLTPPTFETIVAALEADPGLGVAGAYLSAEHPGGVLVRERCPADHVRGPTKFYRRACFEQIAPLPPILGWDTIDEVTARMHGWRTASLAIPGGDPVHMRPVGSHDGSLRAFSRWGECAWGYGAHPLWVLLGGVARLRDRPRVAGGAAYVAGYGLAALRRRPRAEADTRRFARREEMRRLRRMLRNGGRRSPTS